MINKVLMERLYTSLQKIKDFKNFLLHIQNRNLAFSFFVDF